METIPPLPAANIWTLLEHIQLSVYDNILTLQGQDNHFSGYVFPDPLESLLFFSYLSIKSLELDKNLVSVPLSMTLQLLRRYLLLIRKYSF